MSGGPAAASGSPLVGIGLKIASVAIFVSMQTMIKLAGDFPPGETVFFRSAFAIIPIIVMLAVREDLAGAMRSKRPISHIARGIVGVTAMGLGFFALARLPLPEAITLNYAQPLLVVVFSAVLLRETVRLYRWSAVAVGLVGVAIVSYPKLTLLEGGVGSAEAFGVIAALIAAAVSALAMILVRSLVHSEKTSTIVLWFSLTATVVSLGSIPFGWVMPTPLQAAYLILAGIFGGVAQLFMTEAYRHAEASVVAPFEYASLILGIAFGYTFFSELPTPSMLLGGLIVAGAGLFIIWRERQLGIRRTKARKVAAPQ